MVGESGKGKSGAIFRYYKCPNAKRRKGCSRKAIRKAIVEDFVIEYIRKFLIDDALIKMVAEKLYAVQKQDNSELPILKKELAETGRAADNMLNAIQQGIWGELTKTRLDELQERKTDLEIRIANAEILRNVLTKEQILFWLHQFRKYDFTNEEQRQRLVDTFINALYVFDDKVVFALNYRDGTETVSLSELGCSDLDSFAVPLLTGDAQMGVPRCYMVWYRGVEPERAENSGGAFRSEGGLAEPPRTAYAKHTHTPLLRSRMQNKPP
jgi:hypothetical protein